MREPAGRPGVLGRSGMTIVEGDPMGPLRDVLAEFVVASATGGTPVVVVLTDETAPQYRGRLRRLDVGLADAADRLHFVDACAPHVGWAHTDANTVFAESNGADGVLMALAEVQAGIVETHARHVVVVDSMSTIMLLEGPREAFLLARTLGTFCDRMGANVVLGMTRGMHPPEATVPLRQLSDTVLELDRQGAITGPVETGSMDR